MTVTRLLIARHGNTFGPGDIVRRLGLTDVPLVESGLEQGRALGRYLKAQGLLPDVIFTSDLQRTQQTAAQAQLAAGLALPLHPLAQFNEIDYGPDENKPETEVAARVGEAALKAWDEGAIVPDGWKVDPGVMIAEWHHFAARVLRDYAGKTVLVVTSNGIARFAPYLTGDFAAFRLQHKIKIATGALCLFEHDAAVPHWRCMGWNIKPV